MGLPLRIIICFHLGKSRRAVGAWASGALTQYANIPSLQLVYLELSHFHTVPRSINLTAAFRFLAPHAKLQGCHENALRHYSDISFFISSHDLTDNSREREGFIHTNTITSHLFYINGVIARIPNRGTARPGRTR